MEEIDDEALLERTIAALVARKNAAREGSAEYRMALRQLTGLRYTRELAGPIIEELDPRWGQECTPLPRRRGR
jgi:hypothetical protein